MIYIYGASGHGKIIASILELQSIVIDCFIDDNPELSYLCGIRVMRINEVHLSKQDKLIIAIGDNRTRKNIALSQENMFFNVIHPNTYIDKSVEIGKGNLIAANSTINIDASIGNHCIINTSSIVEHDCILEDYVHISPNATLAGGVKVGEGTHVGASATIIPNVTIGKWATIGAGAVIIENIPDYAVVVGNPGKIIKYNIK